MRIALFYPACHRRGGIERVLLECANFLSHRGHEVHLFASEWDAALLDPAITCHRIPRLGGFAPTAMLGYAFHSRRALAAMDPAPDAVGVFGVQCPPGGVFWVPSVHAEWLRISRSRGILARLKQRCNPAHPVILALERFHFGGRKDAKLLAHTDDVRRDLMAHYNVPSGDVAILPNGFSETEFNLDARAANRSAVRKSLGFAETDRVIIFVANELERKGFGPLVRATASLEDPRVHLLAVGRLDPAVYRDEVERLGLSGRVHYTGPSGSVAPYYAAADVFALPTQYEAWGLVIIEAMACGLPVLTSRIAGAAVAIRDGETGRLLSEPRDSGEIAAALRELIAGRHWSPEAISASVDEYQWSRIFLRYEEALAGCIRRQPAHTCEASRGIPSMALEPEAAAEAVLNR
ncbi:MAG TPA: glycosyltransferase family 4 protein [Chthoniobacteraceae bacterium]|jgi:UDP-glucose:(heptosyl)LPS alpha-1,3-glucosyltransferase|nr:glycosyltransferase family 4 protein [Chthoniobacteraceae bacterium]